MRELKLPPKISLTSIERDLIRVVVGRRELRGKDDALAGTGAVHEIDDVFLRFGNLGNVDGRERHRVSRRRKVFRAWE